MKLTWRGIQGAHNIIYRSVVGRCDSSEVLVSSRVRSEMCCVDRRTGFALVFVGIVVCPLLSICSVALPGLAVKETEGHSMQVFFNFFYLFQRYCVHVLLGFGGPV